MDPTQRGDEVAAIMRDYYEANKPLHWWQRRRRYESEVADNLMIGLANIAVIEMERRGYCSDPADAHSLREAATAFLAEADAGHVTVETDGALRSALANEYPADAQPYSGEVNRG